MAQGPRALAPRPRPLSAGGSRTFWPFPLDTPTFASTALRKGQSKRCGPLPQRRRLSHGPTLLWGRRRRLCSWDTRTPSCTRCLFITLAMTHDSTPHCRRCDGAGLRGHKESTVSRGWPSPRRPHLSLAHPGPLVAPALRCTPHGPPGAPQSSAHSVLFSHLAREHRTVAGPDGMSEGENFVSPP